MNQKISILIIILLLVPALYAEKKSAENHNAETFKKYILMPADDSSKDQDFLKYINGFKKAVRDKNIKLLKDNISADILWSFADESGGIDGFLRQYKLDAKSYKESHFWGEMDKILSLGGLYYNEEKTSFAFPYLFVNFPGHDYDSYTFAAVTGKNVNVRNSPDKNSAVIETLSYEIVKVIHFPGYDAKKEMIDSKSGVWVSIRTASGKEGYVFSYYLHSPIGSRAIFEKQKGKWLLKAFITGD
jgi:hypothetical protein